MYGRFYAHRNSESQMLRHSVRWLKENTDIKYLFTWADGIVGKSWLCYQGSNFFFGGFSTMIRHLRNGER